MRHSIRQRARIELAATVRTAVLDARDLAAVLCAADRTKSAIKHNTRTRQETDSLISFASTTTLTLVEPLQAAIHVRRSSLDSVRAQVLLLANWTHHRRRQRAVEARSDMPLLQLVRKKEELRLADRTTLIFDD